jgi:predicted phosphodiesterase
MLFHILSDLHLEYQPDINSFEKFITKFPQLIKNIDINNTKDTILILAGDIGYPSSSNYFEFLKSCCNFYRYVIFVSGNHEYFYSDFDTINKLLIDESFKIPNLFFLLNDSITIDNYRFIGTTLWTNVDKHSKHYVYGSMNDYNTIKLKNKYINVDDTNNFHQEQLEFIEYQLGIEYPEIIKNIVITHHLPSKKLIDQKYIKYGSLNKAFYTDCEYLFDTYKIKAWICGHSHTPINTTINDTKLILNPFGYKNENQSSSIVEIEL